MNNISYLELDETLHHEQNSSLCQRPRPPRRTPMAQSKIQEQLETVGTIGTTHIRLSLSENGDIQTLVRGVDDLPRLGVENLQKYLRYTLGQASDFSFQETTGPHSSSLQISYRYLGNDAGSIKAPRLSLLIETPKGSRKLLKSLMSSLKEVLPTSKSVITPEKEALLQRFSEKYEASIPTIHETITAQASEKLQGVSNSFKASFKDILKNMRTGLHVLVDTDQDRIEKKASVPVVLPVAEKKETAHQEKPPVTIHVKATEVPENVVENRAVLTEEQPKQMQEFSEIVSSVENAVHKEEVPVLKNISGLGNSFMKYLVQASKTFFVRKSADRSSLMTATAPVRSKLQPWAAKTTDGQQNFMKSLVSRVARVFSGAARRGKEAYMAATNLQSTERLNIFSRAKAQFFRLLDGVTLNNQAPLKNPTVTESTRFETVARTKTSAAFVNGKSTGTYRPGEDIEYEAQSVVNTQKSSKNGLQRPKNTKNTPKTQRKTASVGKQHSSEIHASPWQKFSRWTKSLFVAR